MAFSTDKASGRADAGGVASQAVADQGVDDQVGGGRPAGNGDAHPGEDVGLVGGHWSEAVRFGEDDLHLSAAVGQVAGSD